MCSRDVKLNNLLKWSLSFLSLLLFTGQIAYGASINLIWDPNDEADLSGYRIYYGTSSENYDQSIDVGNVTSYKLSGLTKGIIYYVALTSYDTSNNESEKTDEVSGIAQLLSITSSVSTTTSPSDSSTTIISGPSTTTISGHSTTTIPGPSTTTISGHSTTTTTSRSSTTTIISGITTTTMIDPGELYVHGHVVDNEDNGIRGIPVHLNITEKKLVLTDTEGYFIFPDLEEDIHYVWPESASIYTPEQMEVELNNQPVYVKFFRVDRKSCPITKIYGTDSREADILRALRDNFLKEELVGRELIHIYYANSPMFVKMLEEDVEFKEEVKELIDGVLELIEEEME